MTEATKIEARIAERVKRYLYRAEAKGLAAISESMPPYKDFEYIAIEAKQITEQAKQLGIAYRDLYEDMRRMIDICASLASENEGLRKRIAELEKEAKG